LIDGQKKKGIRCFLEKREEGGALIRFPRPWGLEKKKQKEEETELHFLLMAGRKGRRPRLKNHQKGRHRGEAVKIRPSSRGRVRQNILTIRKRKLLQVSGRRKKKRGGREERVNNTNLLLLNERDEKKVR